MKRDRDLEGDREEVEVQEAQRRKSEDGRQPGTQGRGGPVATGLEDSQIEQPYGSQLSDSQTDLIADELDRAMPLLTQELQDVAEQYAAVLEREDAMAIEAVFGTPESFEPVTTRTTPVPVLLEEPQRDVVVTDALVMETDEEKSGEAAAAEADEVTEVALDDDTSAYLGQEAESLFDEAVREVLDGLVAKAKATSDEFAQYPSRLLRLEIEDNPRVSALINQVRDEALDGLRAEIWSLFEQEGMVES